MQKLSLYRAAGLLVLLAAGIYSCKKVNSINNNQVIETPYSLYFADTASSLYYTNDGIRITQVYTPDGHRSRAICNFGSNLLWCKNDLLISRDNGRIFNHTYDSLLSRWGKDCSNDSLNLNQSMIIYLSDWNRVYTVSSADPEDVQGHPNYLGLVFNDSLGFRPKWTLDLAYDTNRVGKLPVRVRSLTRLKNGILCGLALYDDRDGTATVKNWRTFYRVCVDCKWRETTGNPDVLTDLPQYTTDAANIRLPDSTDVDGSYFTLGHFNNRLIAIDGICNHGAWYSDDTGRVWKQYDGIPTGVASLCIAAPFEEVCLVGTNTGLYMLNVQTQRFELNTNGLTKGTKVRGIAFKENVFKNKTSKRYIYLATDKGIFQSTDGGHNWVLTVTGNFTAIY